MATCDYDFKNGAKFLGSRNNAAVVNAIRYRAENKRIGWH
jgi:hypothetical protein